MTREDRVPLPPRRGFLKSAALAAGAVAWPASAASRQRSEQSRFRIWQLPLSQTPTQGNSYVACTEHGRLIVLDGGVAGEAGYLRGFVGALGNHVDAWFISHPHPDHMGALGEILKQPGDVRIEAIYHSELSPEFRRREPTYQAAADDFYRALAGAAIRVVNVEQPGLTIPVDGVTIKILGVKNEEITTNPYNNSCMVIRLWDAARSFVFLGDTGEQQGDKLLAGAFRGDLDCDILQMAHHGQRGVNRRFYETVTFATALWPTPLWLWNNDAGKGYDTGPWETVQTRRWLEEIGIKKHIVAAEGLQLIDE